MTPAPLAAALPELTAAIRNGRTLLLFTDFDGTLVEIGDLPFEIYPSPAIREALHAIAIHPTASAAVVSGRDLADLRPRIGVETLHYAGNHGLEIVGPDFEFVAPGVVEGRAELAAIVAELTAAIAGIPGAWVQDKGLSLAVHFRLTPPEQVPTVAAAVERIASPYRERFVLRGGKDVLEVRPAIDWHKGAAVRWLSERLAADRDVVSLFLGDDLTDEDAFAALPGGVTVLVGESRPTAARFWAEGPTAVGEFLQWLAGELQVTE